MPIINEDFRCNGYEYKVEIDTEKEIPKLDITANGNRPKPESLFKYSAFSNYGVDSLLNNYLFASHPMQLNDIYDCPGEANDLSNYSLEDFKEYFKKNIDFLTDEQIEEFYNSEARWILERYISDAEKIRLFFKFGVISLTENPTDILMWAYYALNGGFAVKYKTSSLPKELMGPFPINYVEQLEKIDRKQHTPVMALLFQTNIKKSDWSHEKEWRYLAFNGEGKYHPYHSNHDFKSRKYFYDKSSVEEIIIGYNFFPPTEMKIINGENVMCLSSKTGIKKLKRKFLNYIVSNKIPTYDIVKKVDEYRLGKRKIEIKKLSSNKFIINQFNEDISYD